MSIVCAVKKHNEIAISADSLLSYGSLKVTAGYLKNSKKLHAVNGSVIGLVGWSAITTIVEHLIENEPELFRFANRMEIVATLLKLHDRMKDDYFMQTREDSDQPVESMQLHGLVINQHGLFEVNSYREVNEYDNFWAIGSGRRLALGAMHALYEQELSAQAIAEAGIRAAAEFDDGCCLPLNSGVVCERELKAVVL